MDFEIIIPYIFYIGIFIAGVGMLVIIVCASAYDVITEARRLHGQTTKTSQKSTLTILIYVNGECSGLKDCISSISKNHYSACDVVVVDNMSPTLVRREITDVISSSQRLPIYFYKNRRKVAMTAACKEGYKRSMRGESILIITPNIQLPPTMLQQLNGVASAGVCGLIPLRYCAALSFESAYAQLNVAAQDMALKARCMMRKEDASSLLVGGVYLKDVFAAKKKVRVRIRYLSGFELRVSSSSIWGYLRQRDKWYAELIRFVTAVIAASALWVAATSNDNTAFLIIWSMSVFWAVTSLCQYKNIDIRTKAHLLGATGTVLYVRIVNNMLHAVTRRVVK